MNEQRFFADVDLPFHVWVREGRRWVLRDAASRMQGDARPRERGEGRAARPDDGSRR